VKIFINPILTQFIEQSLNRRVHALLK